MEYLKIDKKDKNTWTILDKAEVVVGEITLIKEHNEIRLNKKTKNATFKKDFDDIIIQFARDKEVRQTMQENEKFLALFNVFADIILNGEHVKFRFNDKEWIICESIYCENIKQEIIELFYIWNLDDITNIFLAIARNRHLIVDLNYNLISNDNHKKEIRQIRKKRGSIKIKSVGNEFCLSEYPNYWISINWIINILKIE